MAGNHVGLELLAECLGKNYGVEEYGWLSNFSLLQLFFCTGKHDVGDAETEHLISLLKHLFSQGIVVVEVLAHSYELCALSGENECFHNVKSLCKCSILLILFV